MKKRILLIGGNFYPEPTGIGKFNGEMVDFLASQSYECTVITSYPYYPYWKVQEPYCKRRNWYTKESKETTGTTPIEIYRCPQYVPKVPSGMKRILLDFSFCLSSFFVVLMLLFRKRYDAVISVAPCFQVGLLAVLYKKIRGGKFVYHVQDLQIDAARDLQMIKSPWMIDLLLKVEKFILRNADTVSSISLGMIKRIARKYKREIVFLPNWVDTRSFYPVKEKSKLKKAYGFDQEDKIVLYSGAIGEKQGLEAILYTAHALRNHRSIKFVISGSGPYKQKLEQLKDRMLLKNVVFLPLQPFETLNEFLNMADIHLVLQKANVSDLVMPSKLTAILSVGGLAIVTAHKESSLFEFVSRHELGILIEPENQSALTSAISKVLIRNANAGDLNQNARRYAEEYLSIEKIIPDYTLYIQ